MASLKKLDASLARTEASLKRVGSSLKRAEATALRAADRARRIVQDGYDRHNKALVVRDEAISAALRAALPGLTVEDNTIIVGRARLYVYVVDNKWRARWATGSAYGITPGASLATVLGYALECAQGQRFYARAVREIRDALVAGATRSHRPSRAKPKPVDVILADTTADEVTAIPASVYAYDVLFAYFDGMDRRLEVNEVLTDIREQLMEHGCSPEAAQSIGLSAHSAVLTELQKIQKQDEHLRTTTEETS